MHFNLGVLAMCSYLALWLVLNFKLHNQYRLLAKFYPYSKPSEYYKAYLTTFSILVILKVY
jgi:hypothetical protein